MSACGTFVSVRGDRCTKAVGHAGPHSPSPYDNQPTLVDEIVAALTEARTNPEARPRFVSAAAGGAPGLSAGVAQPTQPQAVTPPEATP